MSDRSTSVPFKALGIEHPAGGFIRPYQRELRLLGRALDMASLGASLQLGLLLAGWDWSERYLVLTLVACVVFSLFAEAMGLYYDRRSAPLRFDLAKLGTAWFGTAFTMLLIGYAFQVSDQFSRAAIGAWLLLAPASLIVTRVGVRAVLIRIRGLGYNRRRVVIIGASEQGLRVADTVQRSPWMGLELVGIFDDRAPAAGRLPDSLPCPLLGTSKDLVDVIRRGSIDVACVTLPIHDNARIASLLTMLSDTTISVYFVPDMFLFSMFHGRWVHIGDLPAVSVFETPFYGIEGWVKRAEDLVVASGLLALLGLPMLCIAAAVRLTSPGPALFKQRRYGLDGREFRMWKFRTMTQCEDDDVVPQARRGDPRVTRLGAFLRRTSLDELPQLINVLAGTMSVVGPRPHASAHNEYYRRLVRHYMVRHKVRPGLTGWAQVNGLRGETDTLDKMERRVEFDLWYIRNWSIMLDLRIVLLTLVRGWRDENAF